MDFYKISVKTLKDGTSQIYPDFVIGRSKDLMVRGRGFYAIWDEEKQLWSTDEYDVQRLVDQDLHRFANENPAPNQQVMNLKSFNTKVWTQFRQFMQNISDNSHPLDEKLVFANTEVKKSDYASRRLSYSLEPGSIDAWDELLRTLYSPDERAKIEWAIGAVVSGDSKRLQKFLVFYGPAGSGKSTVLNIIQRLFEGYVTTFDAKALGSSNNAFSTEVFKSNPLVAIQHDGDLSKIDDNTKLNSIISHEDMTMNEKYKPAYSARVNAFLFMGTNQPVKISDAKSGIIRRLIDVHPTGVTIESQRYHILLNQIEFELGAIAHHCLETYKEMGRNYYSTYKPTEMMLQTDIFYNYVEAYFDVFKAEDGVTLKRAYQLYKEWCLETGIEKLMPQYKFREELRNYFDEFQERLTVDGVTMRSYYSGFKGLDHQNEFKPDIGYTLELVEGESIFDSVYSEQPAQYAKISGNESRPEKKWENNKKTLKDLDTTQLHYVQIPEQHIVVDFDLVNEDGEKDIELNIAAASKMPPTYTEISQGGAGIHLHYIYAGDVHELASVYDVGIEVKTLLGDASLRRRLTKCNNLEIATISGGLPKKEKRMIENAQIKTEKGLRDLIDRNLRKEIHAGTKPSVDFIEHILNEAYESGMHYDVRDMRSVILTFAAKSTHQADTAIKAVQRMQFVSADVMDAASDKSNGPIVFFDVEVYPNLFVICWKRQGKSQVVRMVNPTAAEVEQLFSMKLVGFNNRRYDNHVLYSRYMGGSLEDLYRLTDKMINQNDRSVMFGEAYNLSFADIYEFSSKKQSLKKFQIDLGIHHMELDLPFDQPVPEELWGKVIEYCVNDVLSTEIVFEDRKADFTAREILAELSGLPINHTTQNHTARIVFGQDKKPQDKFIYTDLSETFPGYKFESGISYYREENPGEGGYVYAEPGMYENVAVLDVASMHPASIENLNLFGPYTRNYSDLKAARLAIKHKDFASARKMLGGRLAPYLDDETQADNLAYALKIVINTVYGLTSAKFDNPFRDIRNVDNIVAKRGALFMIDLKKAVQEKGFQVVHIKTDSIKIPEATPTIIKFVTEFGQKYGYDFEHETTYDKFCLVNDAVYIARTGEEWTAVGAQFQHPFVFKTLFTNQPITFDDICETKSVTQGAMYLDFEMEDHDPDKSSMSHVGRTGSFVPVVHGGGALWRVKEDKFYAVTGTKGYFWIEREMAANRDPNFSLWVDHDYFEHLRRDAVEAIEKFGSFENFIS